MKQIRYMTVLFLGILGIAGTALAIDVTEALKREFPKTDFSTRLVPLNEIISGGPPKDGIPAIDNPRFISVEEASQELAETEPVISIEIDGKARTYPYRILMFHEIANDRIGDRPVAVTYCPLCNSAIAFDRTVDGRVLDFGTTGRLRHSDLVMYDRQTESWWQQYTGRAIIGEYAESRTVLEKLPARIESFGRFADRHPDGEVLAPPRRARAPYGMNAYAGYDSSPVPYFQVQGELPAGVRPMDRVITVGERAWTLDYVRGQKQIETRDGLIITWEEGQNSALDSPIISRGKDVGNTLVSRKTGDGGREPVVYGVDFAFAFRAFHPDGEIVTGN